METNKVIILMVILTVCVGVGILLVKLNASTPALQPSGSGTSSPPEQQPAIDPFAQEIMNYASEESPTSFSAILQEHVPGL